MPCCSARTTDSYTTRTGPLPLFTFWDSFLWKEQNSGILPGRVFGGRSIYPSTINGTNKNCFRKFETFLVATNFLIVLSTIIHRWTIVHSCLSHTLLAIKFNDNHSKRGSTPMQTLLQRDIKFGQHNKNHTQQSANISIRSISIHFEHRCVTSMHRRL